MPSIQSATAAAPTLPILPFEIAAETVDALPPDMQTALNLICNDNPLMSALAMNALAQKFSNRVGLPDATAARVVDAMIAGATVGATGAHAYATPMFLSALLFYREDALPKIRDILVTRPGGVSVSDKIVPAQVLWQSAFGALALAPDTAVDVVQLLQNPIASWKKSGRNLVLRALGAVAPDLKATMLPVIDFVLQPDLITRTFTKSTGNTNDQPLDVRSMWNLFWAMGKMGMSAAPQMEYILSVLDQWGPHSDPNFALKSLRAEQLALRLSVDPNAPKFHERVIAELKKRDDADPEKLPGSVAAAPYLLSEDPELSLNAHKVVGDPTKLLAMLVRNLATLGDHNYFDPFSAEDSVQIATAHRLLPSFGLSAWRALAVYQAEHADVGFLTARVAPMMAQLALDAARDLYNFLEFQSVPRDFKEIEDPDIRSALVDIVLKNPSRHPYEAAFVSVWGPEFVLALEQRSAQRGVLMPNDCAQLELLAGLTGRAGYRGWSGDPVQQLFRAAKIVGK